MVTQYEVGGEGYGTQQAELVAVWVCHDCPIDVALTDRLVLWVHPASEELTQQLDERLGRWSVIETDVAGAQWHGVSYIGKCEP